MSVKEALCFCSSAEKSGKIDICVLSNRICAFCLALRRRFRSLQFSILASSGLSAVPGGGGFAGTLCALSTANTGGLGLGTWFSARPQQIPQVSAPPAFSGRPTIRILFLLRRFSRSSAFWHQKDVFFFSSATTLLGTGAKSSSRVEILCSVLGFGHPLSDTLHVMAQQPFDQPDLLHLSCERGVWRR